MAHRNEKRILYALEAFAHFQKGKNKIHRRSCTRNWPDKQSCAIKWLFDRTFYFYNFSQSTTLPVYLFVSLFVNLHFLFYNFSALNIFSSRFWFRLCENFRTCSWQVVDDWFKVNSHGQFIFGKQILSFFWGNTLSNKTEGIISHIF